MKIFVYYSIFETLRLGIYPLYYWSKEYKNLDGTLHKTGDRIYGVQISLLGFTIGISDWKWNLYIRRFIQLIIYTTKDK